jgi:nucleotide-binding universal stress UspA family protein
MRRVLLGSVTEAILRQAEIPVFVLRARTTEAAARAA